VSDFPRPPRRPVLVPSALSLEDISRQLTLLRFDMNDRMEGIEARLTTVQAIVEDHIPRMSAVEAKTTSPAKTVGKYAAIAAAIPVLLQILAELKPSVAGPIQTLIGFFQ